MKISAFSATGCLPGTLNLTSYIAYGSITFVAEGKHHQTGASAFYETPGKASGTIAVAMWQQTFTNKHFQSANVARDWFETQLALAALLSSHAYAAQLCWDAAEQQLQPTQRSFCFFCKHFKDLAKIPGVAPTTRFCGQPCKPIADDIFVFDTYPCLELS